MKVKRAVPISQFPDLGVAQEMQIDKAATPNTIADDRAMPSRYNSSNDNSLPPYEDLDPDLALEGDGLLQKPDLNTNSKQPKVWQVKGSNITLTALEATIAVKRDLFTYADFTLYTSLAASDPGPTDPVTGALSAAFGTIGTIAQRASDYPLLFSKVLDAKQEGEAHAEIADFVKDPSKGVSGIIGAGLKAPMDITMNVSRGFHNLPKLYGDEVREGEKVTNVQSGLQAAGKGFGLGLWDGLSGLITQPIKGAEEGGFVGGLIGFGKGLGGVVCKPAAGAVGIPGNLFKGIYEEVQKTRKAGVEVETLEVQTLQGFREWEVTREEERNLIYQRIKRMIEDYETLEN